MKYFKYLPIAAFFATAAFASTPNEEAASASADVVMEKPSLFASQSSTVSAVVGWRGIDLYRQRRGTQFAAGTSR